MPMRLYVTMSTNDEVNIDNYQYLHESKGLDRGAKRMLHFEMLSSPTL